MKLKIMTTRCDLFKEIINEDDTVLQLKQKIERSMSEHIDPYRQKLVYRGSILHSDQVKLKDYNVRDQGNIVLLVIMNVQGDRYTIS